MMRVIRLMLAACLSFSCLLFAVAELEDPTVGRLAVIEDPDGFVNMRSKPEADSEVVLKIQKDEFFVCEPAESDWWHVEDFFGNEGYMHKSRIRLIKDLPGKALERLFVNPPLAPDDDALVDIDQVSERYYERYNDRDKRQGAGSNDSRLRLDGSLFHNEKLDQCIFITHHTDGMIPKMVLFSSIDVPDGVFGKIEMHTLDGDLASLEAKKVNWSDLLAESITIPARHFQTALGLKLGDGVEKAIKIFGEPHNQRTINSVLIYEWGFPGGYYYGWDYTESSLGFFDMGRVTEDRKLIKKSRLDDGEREKIQQHFQSPRGYEFIKGLLDWVLPRTRGSRVHCGLGYYVRLYVRDGKIIALAYEWGFE
jgi:hypothetical protein